MATERTRPNAGGDATRAALIDAAERLYAERGVDAVSLREIGVAAGQRKSNVAQYHFGDRDGLVRAIVLSRSSTHNVHRNRLLAQSRPDGRGLAEALVEPLAADLGRGGSYVRFLFQLQVASAGRLPFTPDLDPAATESFRDLLRQLRAALPRLDPHVLQARAALAVDFTVMALADRALAEAAGPKPPLSRSRFVAETVRATAGILGTPCK